MHVLQENSFKHVILLITLGLFWSKLMDDNTHFSSIDKAIHSDGPKQGYALAKRSLPNPVDIVLVFSQKVQLGSSTDFW